MAVLYRNQGRYADAEMLLSVILLTWERTYGTEHPQVAAGLNNLAELYQAQGRYPEAETLYKRSLAIKEKAFGTEHLEVALVLNNLADLYRAQGRHTEAEPLYKHSLAIWDKAFGPMNLNVATGMNNLAALLVIQGRHTEAEPLYKRSLAILEQAFGPEHPKVATSLNNLAALYSGQGRHPEAEPLYKRSLAILERALGPEHPEVALVLNNLADLSYALGRYPDAEPPYKRSLAIREKALGPEHPEVALVLNDLALLYHTLGRYPDAEPLYKRSLAIREKALGPKHPDVATSLNNLAGVYLKLGRFADILPLSRRAIHIHTSRFSLKDESSRSSLRAEQRKWSWYFEGHVFLLHAAGPAAGTPEAVASESFEIAQWARASDTAEQVAKMAARHAAGSDVLAKVARERQDLLARLEKLEADLLAEVSKPADKRNAERDRNLRQQEAETKTRLRDLDARIAKEFPSYAELTQPKPLAVAEAQKLLGADEALVLWLVGEKESYLWAVRRDKARFARVEIDRKALEGKVKVLRMGLDPQNIQGTTELPMFRPLLAHELYQLFLAPAEDLLEGAKHLIIVPDGPLQSLPPQVLVTKKPEKPDEEPGKIEWLVRRHAVSVLPAAGALRALRQFAQPPKQREPFAGFGDPVLEGKAGAARGADAKRLFTRGALADVTEVRQMNRLPDTAKELRHIAGKLKADPKALHLAEAMTEARIKALDLTRYRLLAFATHGLMAGDFTALAEPGLVATPPAQASEEDDGVLTASEISRLKLNADWVVLFACNTAAADGTPGAEGLSGLARAFFYAGARALFVSHWEVVSDATAYLAMAMLDNEAAGASRAEAHRQAILKMMNEKSRPDFAHPLMWAPFVVVGEGGRR
ncbi:MAG: tetratricopeptide repeat protein [Rhodocyclaceae bacterium]|nr:tetratricopeptide repeat protein [Rhodocyclaceae bacterium]